MRERENVVFIADYVGAFHAPRPHGVQVGVVGPPQATADLRTARGLHPVPEPDGRTLRAAVELAAAGAV